MVFAYSVVWFRSNVLDFYKFFGVFVSMKFCSQRFVIHAKHKCKFVKCTFFTLDEIYNLKMKCQDFLNFLAYLCHGRYPKQAKTDEIAKSRMVPKDKAYVEARCGLTSVRIFLWW